MGKNHFQQFHNSEPRIKKCLRCLLNEQATIIEQQNEQIKDLEHYLNEKKCKNKDILKKLTDLQIELANALDDVN